MAFADLQEFFDPDLYLPIRGKTYRIASPNAEDGARLRAMFADPEHEWDDNGEIEEMQQLLGPVWDEMQADGIDWESLCHAGLTAMIRYGMGRTVAELHWQTGLGDMGNPLPADPTPNRAAKRAAKKAPAKKTTSSKARTDRTTPARAATAKATPEAATTTPPPASATGITPPQK